jgi:hypothetical protein
MRLTSSEINIIKLLSEKSKNSQIDTVNYLLENKEAVNLCGLSKGNKNVKFILSKKIKELYFIKEKEKENIAIKNNKIKKIIFKNNIKEIKKIDFNIKNIFTKIMKPRVFNDIDYTHVNNEINILFSDIIFPKIQFYFKKSTRFHCDKIGNKYELTKTSISFDYKKYYNLGDFLLEYQSDKKSERISIATNIEDFIENDIKLNLEKIFNMYFIKDLNCKELEFLYKHIIHYIYKIKIGELFSLYGNLSSINYFKKHKEEIFFKKKQYIVENHVLKKLNYLHDLTNIKVHIINKKNIHTIIDLEKFKKYKKDFLILLTEDLCSKYLNEKISIFIEQCNVLCSKNKNINLFYGIKYNNGTVNEIEFNNIPPILFPNKNTIYKYKNFKLL